MGTVILSHGFVSGPDASKTTAMGEVAAGNWIASQFGVYLNELAHGMQCP